MPDLNCNFNSIQNISKDKIHCDLWGFTIVKSTLIQTDWCLFLSSSFYDKTRLARNVYDPVWVVSKQLFFILIEFFSRFLFLFPSFFCNFSLSLSLFHSSYFVINLLLQRENCQLHFRTGKRGSPSRTMANIQKTERFSPSRVITLKWRCPVFFSEKHEASPLPINSWLALFCFHRRLQSSRKSLLDLQGLFPPLLVTEDLGK